MKASEYATAVRRRVGDTGAHFTDMFLLEAANRACKIIAQSLKPGLLPELMTVVTDDLSDSAFAVATNMVQWDSLTLYNTTNRDIQVTLVGGAGAYLRRKELNYFMRPTRKQFFGYLEDGMVIIEPPVDNVKYKFRYVRCPETMTAPTTDELELEPRWESLAIDYGQYLAYLEELRAQEAQVALQTFQMNLERANATA